jgi:multimeric flavodoxin WrbA
MIKVVAINGSPRKEKGNTARVLTPFIQGMMDAGAEVELFYASRLKIKPCSCGVMYCWSDRPGECCLQDEMQLLYPKLRTADVIILATPVYIPLPGDMQNFINRLCPLLDPHLEKRQGRTRARFRKDVNIRQFVLVSTGGWWEIGNFDTVVRVVEELALDAGVKFGGAVLRPHAFLMMAKGKLTKDGEAVLDALRKAGSELIREGEMHPGTLELISRPMMSEEALRQRYNQEL